MLIIQKVNEKLDIRVRHFLMQRLQICSRQDILRVGMNYKEID